MLGVVSYTSPVFAATQVSQFGITWTFDRDYTVGQFANGDYWVVGPVTITSITKPHGKAGRDGSMINPTGAAFREGGLYTQNDLLSAVQGYDDRLAAGYNRYDPAVDVSRSFPLNLAVNYSLVSTVSWETGETGCPESGPQGPRPLIRKAAILTVLGSVPPANAFRPPYAGNNKPIYTLSQIQWNLLPNLTPVPSAPTSLTTVEDWFKMPWIDHGAGYSFDEYIHPSENFGGAFPMTYGQTMSNKVNDASLLLLLNFSQQEKQTLMTRLVQLGIDNYGAAKNGAAWVAGGGQGYGRKWAIIFAGIMLNEPSIWSYQAFRCSENDNTYFGDADHQLWTGWQNSGHQYASNVMWGMLHVRPDKTNPQSADHEHVHPKFWDTIVYEGDSPVPKFEGYRRQVSPTIVGTALAAHILGTESLWNHDAFFAYADRWMYENDTLNVDIIHIYFPSWSFDDIGGKVASNFGYGAFVKDMWNAYRDYHNGGQRASKITQYGITWTFDKEYEYGQFANGDYWVVGPVKIASITPTPAGGRNGFEINPMPGTAQPYDSRNIYDGAPASSYNAALQPSLPVSVQPNSSVLSTISNPETPDCSFTAAGKNYVGWHIHPDIDMPGFGEDNCEPSVLKTAAVLTVLDSPAPAGSFRPPYVGSNKPLYSSLNLHRDLLLSLAPVGGEPALSKVERKFERVWLDHIFEWPARALHPVDNMHGYGAGISVDAGEGALRLLLNDSLAEKETLLVRYVQTGIDLYWMTKYGHSWRANGGHGSGRKLPILFAGLMLNDSDMKNIGSDSLPYNGFGEDCQTYYDASGYPRWGIRHCWQPSLDDETNGYRSCCTSQSWVAQTLAAELLGLEGAWNHPAYFDYMDRWMTENNNGDWGSPWADLMWAAYRSDDTTPPLSPSSLTYSNRTESSITLTWVAPGPAADGDYAAGYRVFRNGTLVAQVVQTSFQDTDLAGATTYNYEVYSIDDAGNPSTSAANRSFSTLSDTTPPTIVSVSATRTSVSIVFNEPLDSASAQNISNYVITGGITISAASLSADLKVVTLATSAHTECSYVLVVTNVKDLAGNPMPQTTRSYQYEQGLVAYWKFDEGAGATAGDSSATGNSGTLVNGASWAAGWSGSAIRFDGFNDAVEIRTTNVNPAQGTIALWAYAQAFSANNSYFFGHAIQPWNNVIQLYALNGSLTLGIGNSHTARTNIQSLVAGRWYHLALSWNGTSYVVYVDGQAKATGAYSGLASLESYADIGNNGNRAEREAEALNGLIDEVRIYNRPLAANEVAELVTGRLVFAPIGDKQVNEGSTLTFEIVTYQPGVQVSIQNNPGLPFEPSEVLVNNVFTWAVGYDKAGAYEVTFVAPNGELEDYETITITVNSINRPPFLVGIGNKNVNENEILSFSVTAVDPDGDNVVYSVLNLPRGAAFADRVFAWTPSCNQAGSYEVTFVASDGQGQYSRTVTIVVNDSIPVSPVYRFWSASLQGHFYTISESEKNKLITNYSSVWKYEGVSFYAYQPGTQPADTQPVYRFWSPTKKAHFFTISSSEKDKLIVSYSSVWSYEGIAWYAYQVGRQPAGTKPVYRFWSGSLGKHFYTVSESEKNKLIANYSSVWKYEGIAWYAWVSDN
jgi:hypothetical protein